MMGNPIQTIPNLPPAVTVAGPEQVWINQAGVDRRTTLAQIAGLVVVPPHNGAGGGNTETVGDYASIRTTSFPPSVTSIFLDDPYKGGTYVRGPGGTDNGGTRIADASGQMWWRVYDGRINAAWFYSGPPDSNGNPTTLGSGPAVITAADAAANPQWIGLADDGGTGVQTAMPYPLGTYWDFVCLQEWVYACAAERSVPQSTFIGEMDNDGRVTITQWLTGPQFLGAGQPISGVGVAPGTYVTAPSSDPNVYWVGQSHNTGGLDITTDRGTHFRGWVEGDILTASGFIFTGPPMQAGDELIDPLYPPNSFYNGVLPGTVVGPQIDGPPGGALGSQADWYIGVKQSVASTTMTGVGGPTWNLIGGQYYRNQPGYCPPGLMYLNQMLVCNASGLDLLFSSRLGTNLFWYGTATGTSPVGPGLKFNSLSYSTITNLAMSDRSSGVTNYLLSVSHTASTPGLNVQNNTWNGLNLGGNYITSKCGMAISPEGGAAQGDTQMLNLCQAAGFDDGFINGGDNAVADTWFGGQTIGCPHYGIGAEGGTFSAYTFLTENNAAWSYYQVPQRMQIHLGGADFYQATVSSMSSVSIGTRSEGLVGMTDLNGESSVMNWTCGGYMFAWGPNTHWTPQTLLSVNNAIGSYSTVMLVDDGGPPWMQSDPSSTTTVLTFNPSPGWTVNQWAGFGIWLKQGNNANSNAIVSNTANTLTLSGGVNAAGANWWKIFASTGGVAPNWAATTHFGQFRRNAVGWGATIAAGFNLVASASLSTAGDWVMLPGQAVFPDSIGAGMALTGKLGTQHPASSGYFFQSFGTAVNIWGAPTNPIMLGGFPASYNPLLTQVSGTPGGVGQYTQRYNQTIGADFTGSITGSFLTVTAVNNGSLGAGYYLGGASVSTTTPPQITAPGVTFTGFVDDGTGGVTPGSVLTVQAMTDPGVIRPGTPLTGGQVGASTVITSQIGGTPGGVGTYNIYEYGTGQLVPQCQFTGSLTTGQAYILTVSAVASGKLVPGQLIQGAGIPANTFLGQQKTGAAGGVGTYQLGVYANIAAEAMTATWNLSCGGQAAQFTAHIDDGAGNFGRLLTVTAVAGGVLGVGQTINYPVTGGPAGLTAQATIIHLPTDTGTGGVGTYTLSGIGNIIVPSSSMTANTTDGIGVYALNAPLGSPITNEPMLAGVAAAIPTLWEIVDSHGNPQNAANDAVDGFGYWSAGISDSALTHMVIDWDVMYGVGALDQCQLGGLGKVSAIGRLDNVGAVQNEGLGQMFRPGDFGRYQLSWRTSAQLESIPNGGVVANTNPFTIDASVLNQSNVFCTVAANNVVLGIVPLGPGVTADYDLWLTPNANIVGGMLMTWDATTVKAPAAGLNLGQGNQTTIVRLKWLGNDNYAAPGGHWYVVGVEGPM